MICLPRVRFSFLATGGKGGGLAGWVGASDIDNMTRLREKREEKPPVHGMCAAYNHE